MITKNILIGTLLAMTGVYTAGALDVRCGSKLFIENKSDAALMIIYTTREGIRVEKPMLQGEKFKELICINQLLFVAFARHMPGAREIALDDQLDTIRQDAHAPCLKGKIPVITIAAVSGGWSTTVEWHAQAPVATVARPALPD